ncbi:MAG TPA: MlaD family protein [Solirubrobacteraceae bacterium]|nr:MlaD family protein [Solirubrobacteraceae bacterium]
MRAISKHRRDFIAILLLGLIAAGTAAVVLPNERFRFPWEASPYKLKAAFSTAQAVTPGQGQTVRVSGVRIGDIAHVALQDGQAIITMDIDPTYKDLIHTDATALLRPKTGLKDMFIEVNPGSHSAPVARENSTLPIQNTLPDVNPDEVYSALDADTRDYLKLLIDGAGRGLKGRGADLQEVFRRFEPTHRDLQRVQSAVAVRSHNLARLITSLNTLNAELSNKRNDLATLVSSSAAVFNAFASEDKNLSQTVANFPAALRQTTDTLGKVKTFADVLGPTAENLRPAVRSLNTANHAVTPFALEATPILKNQIRPFVRAARPVVRDLRPAAINLAKATPQLTSSFVVLNHFFNLLGYNPTPSNPTYDGSQPASYLFWLAWADHMGLNLFSTQDANGPFRPVALEQNCATIKSELAAFPTPVQQAGFIFVENLAPILTTPGLCG